MNTGRGLCIALQYYCILLFLVTEGYVDIDAFLDLPEAACYTLADVERVVLKDSKGRFKIREHCGVKQIKATQGHSMTVS